MDINLDVLEKLGPLKSGSHSGPDAGACILEAVSFVAGEPWSDHPQCVSPVIGAFLRNWNDNLPTDADRERLLKPLIPKIMNTRADAATEERRSYLALDWMIRTFLPAWLRLAKLNDRADAVAGLAPIVDMVTATAAAPVVRAANEAASKARAAARDAAGAAARAAARDAAGAAAVDAARDAAWAAALAAARAAARDAAWAAARAAARDAARDAAGAAAVDAARAAAWAAALAAARAAARDAAWAAARGAARDAAGAAARAAAVDAARAAARAVLKATRDELQLSAVDLVERMAALSETQS
jgi:hypothetical protein